MAEVQCRHFSGYKPCGKNSQCNSQCPHFEVPLSRILVVHLEALGAVLRATSLLPAIHRRFPRAHVTWVTKTPADQILANNTLIDRVVVLSPEGLATLKALEFDVAFVVDKSLAATGVLKHTYAEMVFGFVADPRTGAILPANVGAQELWEIGLDDHRKFFVNKKPETQLLHEALELDFRRDEYMLPLTPSERELASERRRDWKRQKSLILGINTGCSAYLPYKKLTVNFHRELIQTITRNLEVSIVLLGGKEDAERNRQIAANLEVIESPTHLGLRDGAVSTEACDLILTGDSLGMHMGIALRKWVVAWFGSTCAHEIDFYDRGRAILSQATCGPCWKRFCDKNPMCYDLVDSDELIRALREGIHWAQNQPSYKQPFSETSSSPSL